MELTTVLPGKKGSKFDKGSYSPPLDATLGGAIFEASFFFRGAALEKTTRARL